MVKNVDDIKYNTSYGHSKMAYFLMDKKISLNFHDGCIRKDL